MYFILFIKIFPDMGLKAEPVSQQFMNMGAYNSPIWHRVLFT
jgi:hypothetical protein